MSRSGNCGGGGGGAVRISTLGVWAIALAALVGAAPDAQAGWRDVVSPAKNWQRIKSGVSYCYYGIKGCCERKVERAKADQRKMWGIKLDGDLRQPLDPRRPLVVLVHGLDSDSGLWDSMAGLLREEGAPVARFAYPNDGPIAASAKMLGEELGRLRSANPGLRVHLVGHSMGCLVARAYVEGPAYGGGVERLIEIGPPNHGSCWARGRFALEWREHYDLWRHNKDWSPIWMFTDGHGEAGDDLKPGSKFLAELNARPRRAGVRYTIVLGTQHACSRMTANACADVEWCLSRTAWGVRTVRAGLERLEKHYRGQTGDGDGVVTTGSALLDGVTDVVRVPADHNALAMSIRGARPAAWEAVRERVR